MRTLAAQTNDTTQPILQTITQAQAVLQQITSQITTDSLDQSKATRRRIAAAMKLSETESASMSR
jgi:hypothetical protein